MGIETMGQPEWVTETITRDRIGFISASLKKTYAEADILRAGLPPAPVPGVLGAIWTRTDVEARDGVATVRWFYEGLAADQRDPIYIYEWQGSFEQVPIQAHPNYRRWIGVYGTEGIGGDWRPFRDLPPEAKQSRPLSKKQADARANPLLGVDSFLSSGGVWVRRYAARVLPQDLLRKIGLIVDRPPGELPPGIPQGRNFLQGPPQLTWRGNAWDVSEQYLLSGRGGWVPLVYQGGTE